ncbi:MAG: hypothetical protein J6M27_01995, partial [Lachnospiraceae bacterium]|nr:hypothetical protein [Lachnospiraceae bacterium]
MRLDDHFDEEFEDFDSYASRREQKGTLKTALLLASLFVLLAVTLVLYVNLGEKKTGRPQPGGSTPAAQAQNGKAAADLEGYISGETRTAEDLGFWHAYDAPADSTLPADEPTEIPTPEPTEMPDPATDGLHTLITYADGTEEWA